MSSSLTLMAPPSSLRLKKPEPAVIEFRNLKFLITERPSDSNMERFVADMKKHKATDVVRVGGATYKTNLLINEGILVTDLPFDDGTAPSSEVIKRWCELLKTRRTGVLDGCIVVHCVAGLGRAPVMVAVALIELGMQYEDAVEMIRLKRRGAINSRQLDFLAGYRPRARLDPKRNSKCVIM